MCESDRQKLRRGLPTPNHDINRAEYRAEVVQGCRNAGRRGYIILSAVKFAAVPLDASRCWRWANAHLVVVAY